MRALNFCLTLLDSQPLSDLVSSVENVEWIKADPESYIHENTYSGQHLIGGASQLVDENFKVKESSDIYVCDASVLSGFVSSNIHSSVVILADCFADKFIEMARRTKRSEETSARV